LSRRPGFPIQGPIACWRAAAPLGAHSCGIERSLAGRRCPWGPPEEGAAGLEKAMAAPPDPLHLEEEDEEGEEEEQDEDDCVSPGSSLTWRELLSPAYAQGVRVKMDDFENRGRDAVRTRLRQLCGSGTMKETDRFLQMMREKGGGNLAVAWRRHFDSDGDGELQFKEFCSALIDLNFKGNVISLWSELRKNSKDIDCEFLRLEDLDKDSAAMLDYFARWCIGVHGGPAETFKAIDTDGSDSLTRDEFAEGLRDLGFFDDPGVPVSLSSPHLVVANLFPLLDQHGTNTLACDQLMFLEKNQEKKLQILKQLARMREHGVEGKEEPLQSTASKMLNRIAMETTMLGGKPWQLVTAAVAVGDRNRSRRSSMATGGVGSRKSSSRTASRPRSAPPAEGLLGSS